MKPILTIFTPTFNRAHTLPRVYSSLVTQQNKQFIWLIVDDGSTDDTKNLVDKWIGEGKIEIRYVYQENKGMHAAHNTAYALIDTELNVCIDSDDYLAEDAVETIITFWRKHGNNKYAGMVGLDATLNNEVIGTALPNIKASTLTDLYSVHKVKGDKKLVYRTELTSKVPAYPIFEGEKYCPLAYKYILIDQHAPLLILNKVLCHVEYQPDGSSFNIIHQYKRNPKGFAFFRVVAMKYAPTYTKRFRESIHYVSSNIMLKNKNFIKQSPCKITTILSTPFGILLFLFLKWTKKSTFMKGYS